MTPSRAGWRERHSSAVDPRRLLEAREISVKIRRNYGPFTYSGCYPLHRARSRVTNGEDPRALVFNESGSPSASAPVTTNPFASRVILQPVNQSVLGSAPMKGNLWRMAPAVV